MNSNEEIGERLRTQDNRITRDPIFTVQQLRKDVCPEDYGDGYEWVDPDSDYRTADSQEGEELDRLESEGADTGDWIKGYYKERWEFVQPFFTETAAQAYIDCNGHNLCHPRIYVISAFRNFEWQAVRNSLMEKPQVNPK